MLPVVLFALVTKKLRRGGRGRRRGAVAVALCRTTQHTSPRSRSKTHQSAFSTSPGRRGCRAYEACRLLGIALVSGIGRALPGAWAQRSVPIDHAVGGMRDATIRSGGCPRSTHRLERGEHVEACSAPSPPPQCPHSQAPANSRYARHARLRGAAEGVDDARAVLRAVAGRDLRIAPAVIVNELAAAIDKRLQVGIERVDRAAVRVLGARGDRHRDRTSAPSTPRRRAPMNRN